jgi:hypothetical protein
MDDEQKKTGRLSYLKDILSLIRDGLIIVVVATCIIHPASIKTFLNDSGLSKLSIFGVTIELKEEKEKIANAQEKVNAKVVTTAAPQGDPPPEALSKPVDPAFKAAILSAERVAPQILPSAGWVFLGRVNKDKTSWADGASSIVTASWPIKTDDKLTVKEDVYVRAITQDKYHSSAPVTTVAKIGDKLTVVELQYSSAKIGGYYVWAKVAIN